MGEIETWILIIFGIAPSVVSAIFGWIVRCEALAYRQRDIIRQAIFRDKNILKLADDYSAVSHHEHAMALVLFRNPMKLYGAAIMRKMKEI